jgi:hypothetical protein
MKRGRARRTVTVAVASALIHLLLISGLVIGVPRLGPPRTVDQPAIQVSLEPPPAQPPPEPLKAESSRAARARSPSSVHRALPVPGLPPPSAVITAPAPQPPPTTPAPPVGSGEGAEMGNVVRALRGSVGCSDPDAVGLTPAEREACRKRFHAGLEDAKPLLGLTAEKRARFDHASRCQDTYRAYRAAQMPNSHTPSNGPIPGLGYVPSPRDCADGPGTDPRP